MYDVNLIRKVCCVIALEQDNEKAQELLDLLEAVVRENDEEIAARLVSLKDKYPLALTPAFSDLRTDA